MPSLGTSQGDSFSDGPEIHKTLYSSIVFTTLHTAIHEERERAESVVGEKGDPV